jgi:hypothetical protein
MPDDAKPQSQPELLEAFASSSRTREKHVADPRHTPFRAILAEYWSYKNHASPEMPWQGRDAKALGDFLAASPNLNDAQFRQMLRNRAKSAVAHGDRVYLWIGNGITCQYETTSTQDLMDVSMLGGVTINALGQGSMTVSVMVARSYANSENAGGSAEIKLAPFPLTPENWRGYDGGARGQNERFRMRFTNGAIANAWFALKYCSLFTRPLYTGRSGDGA